MRRFVAAIAVIMLGCEEDPGPPPEERALVDPHGWMQADPATDAFASMRPADATCDPVEGFGADWLGGVPSWEINTGACNYLTIAQTSLEDVREGDPMELQLWHFELASMEPGASAYVGVAIDGRVAWETTIPIPGAAALVTGEWASPVDAPAGTELQFHLHNHGVNSWDLLEINVTH